METLFSLHLDAKQANLPGSEESCKNLQLLNYCCRRRSYGLSGTEPMNILCYVIIYYVIICYVTRQGGVKVAYRIKAANQLTLK